jgi:hypothetical protein
VESFGNENEIGGGENESLKLWDRCGDKFEGS